MTDFLLCSYFLAGTKSSLNEWRPVVMKWRMDGMEASKGTLYCFCHSALFFWLSWIDSTTSLIQVWMNEAPDHKKSRMEWNIRWCLERIRFETGCLPLLTTFSLWLGLISLLSLLACLVCLFLERFLLLSKLSASLNSFDTFLFSFVMNRRFTFSFDHFVLLFLFIKS